MEEGTKFRLVRCPKCENLLPEPPNLPVYRCGGCDAVLQAKNQPTSSGGSSEKSDDERVRVSSGKLESLTENGDGEELSDGVKKRERGLVNGIGESNSSSSPRIENKVVNEKFNQEQEASPSGKYRRAAKDPVDSWVLGNDHDMNRSREKSVGVNMEKEIGGNDLQKGFASRSRSGQIPNWRSLDRDGSIVYRRKTPRAVEEDVRFSGTPYLDAGPSNYQAGSYGLVEPLKNSDGPDRVEHLEQDRAELLRKLEELNLLKDQLTRSRDMQDKPKEGISFDGRAVPVDPYVDRDAWFPEGSSRQHRASMQPFPAEKHAQRPLYSNCGLESIPTMNRHGMDMQNFYPPLMHASNDIPGYGDPYAAQMVGPNKPPHQYQRHPSRDYYSTQYMGMDSDHNASYPTNTFFHQPACSCLHCYNKQWHAPAQIPPSVLHNRRFPDEASNPMLYHVENRGTFGPRGYNSRDPNLPPMRHVLHPQFGRQNLDTGTSGFSQSHPRRVLPVKRSGRRCCPIAGGAPFITCHNCFELLPLPKKILLMEKNYRKLRCGACSTIISLLIENDRIVASVPVQIDGVPPAVNGSPGGGVEEDVLQSHSRENDHGGVDSSDYDSSGYHFHLTDTEPGSSSMDRKQNINEAEKLEDLVSSCSITSDDDESPDSVIARREVSNSAEPHLKDRGTPPLPASPLREPSNQVVTKFEKGNRSKRINQEEVVLTKGTSRQNSVKDASVATEMDVSFNEYSNGAMSQEYGDVSKEERHRVNKGGDSYFVGLIKKGFKDLSKSHHTGEIDRSNVTINGHPISERSLKKAEKKSGPVHPGQYWYDVRAGFWGVMGQPCLGILPPYIEEFNYPLPENCAGGNTGVYVNGRELHQKDLDLLANRGLPTVTDKSYIIEISGKVTDEDTGEELDNLGKLAPTVEKLKHGFGMRVPRVAV